MALQLKNIIKFYKYGKNKQTVINDLSIKFPVNGLVGIVGQSGSGKSTLLNIIAGIEKPDHGEVVIDGYPLNYHQISTYQRNYISYVYQFYNLVDALTVRENLLLLTKVKGNNSTNLDKKLENYCQKLNMIGLLERYPSELSGGQKQRIGIIRAFLCNTPILLCDEPTGALNEEIGNEVMKLLKSYARNHLVIVISHNYSLINQYTKMIINLDLENNYYDFNHNRYHKYSINSMIKQSGRLFFYTKRQLKYQIKKIVMMFASQIFVILSFVLLVSGFNGGKLYLQKQFSSNPLKEMVEVSKNNYDIFNDNEIKNFKKNKLIDDVNYRLNFDNGVFEYGKEITLNGYQIYNDKHLDYLAGKYPSKKNQIVINQEAAKKYKLKIGSLIKYEINDEKYQFMVSGIINDFVNNNPNIYVDQHYLKNKLLEELYDKSVLIVYGKQIDKIIKQYQKEYLVFNLHREFVDNYKSILELASFVVSLFILVSFIISLILISIILKTIFIERKRDTSLLLVNGLTKQKVASLFCFESTLIGMIIASAGSILAILLLKTINFISLGKRLFGIDNLFVLPEYLLTKYDLFVFLIVVYAMSCYVVGIVTCWQIKNMDISVLLKEN